jgi:hypothetical protein
MPDIQGNLVRTERRWATLALVLCQMSVAHPPRTHRRQQGPPAHGRYDNESSYDPISSNFRCLPNLSPSDNTRDAVPYPPSRFAGQSSDASSGSVRE